MHTASLARLFGDSSCIVSAITALNILLLGVKPLQSNVQQPCSFHVELTNVQHKDIS